MSVHGYNSEGGGGIDGGEGGQRVRKEERYAKRIEYWARICKRLRSPGIDSKEPIPPGYVAYRAGPTNRIVVLVRQVT